MRISDLEAPISCVVCQCNANTCVKNSYVLQLSHSIKLIETKFTFCKISRIDSIPEGLFNKDVVRL